MKPKRIFMASAVIIALSAFLLLMLNSAHKISVKTSAGYSVPENRVVIDAGHGSQDSGAVSADGVLEKGINLAISHDTADLLRLFGYSVSMTRTDDNWLSDEGKNVKERKYNDMRARLKLYNSSPENIVISIHQNKFSDSRSNGTQVFYSPNDGNSSLLAERIKYSVRELLQPENERECKAAGKDIYLLKNAEIPAVLVECGFISNKAECEKLVTDEYQKNMSLAIALGFMDYDNEN